MKTDRAALVQMFLDMDFPGAETWPSSRLAAKTKHLPKIDWRDPENLPKTTASKDLLLEVLAALDAGETIDFTETTTEAPVETQAVEPSTNGDSTRPETAQEAPQPRKGKTNGKKAKGAKPAKEKTAPEKPPAARISGNGGMSMMDAALRVLAESKEKLTVKAVIEKAAESGYWQSSAKTPSQTLRTEFLREETRKDAPRVKKVGPGLYKITAAGLKAVGA